jgi:DNA-binding MarR family transcriptional regulator
MTTADRRLVTDLLKLLPEFQRMADALCALHDSQLRGPALPADLREKLRGAEPPTQTQMQLAIELAQEGQATIRQLALRLGVTPAAVSLLVDRMAEHGWVERTRDEADRRVVWVRLTPLSRSISEALLRVQRGHLVEFLAQVPEEERAPFVRNLAQFTRVMSHADPADAEREHAPRRQQGQPGRQGPGAVQEKAG